MRWGIFTRSHTIASILLDTHKLTYMCMLALIHSHANKYFLYIYMCVCVFISFTLPWTSCLAHLRCQTICEGKTCFAIPHTSALQAGSALPTMCSRSFEGWIYEKIWPVDLSVSLSLSHTHTHSFTLSFSLPLSTSRTYSPCLRQATHPQYAEEEDPFSLVPS